MLYSFLAVALLAPPGNAAERQNTVLALEPNDSLETMRAKIRHNGYTFTVDHNWVYDMPEEMKRSFFSRREPRVSSAALDDLGPLNERLGKAALPASFDWRDHNGHSYIGPVKDQGYCGSCYAFAACAAAEGTYNFFLGLYDGSCIDFSESFIIWCLGRLPEYNSHFFGCDGADYTYAELQALVDDGVCSESDFPYTTFDPGSCTHWGDPVTKFQAWYRLPCNDVMKARLLCRYNFCEEKPQRATRPKEARRGDYSIRFAQAVHACEGRG
jgi:hypothetical protein